MSTSLRSFAILEYLKKNNRCSVRELQEHFRVSQATIHRDLTALAERDLIQRFHGGVTFRPPAAPEGRHPGNASFFQDRLEWNKEAKERIAERALEEIREGDILFLDSSTTVRCLAQKLMRSNFSNLTIVTNAVGIMEQFHHYPPHYVLIALGGCYDRQLNSFLGQAAIREVEHLSLSKAFVSAFGIMDGDVTTNHEYHAQLLSKVLTLAEEKFLLADKSKMNRRGIFKLPALRTFDKWITEM